MNYKKIIQLSLLCAMMLLTGSCAKDYADEIATSDKNVADLKQADIELRKLIQTGIATLNEQITAALNETEKEKRAAIKAKVEQWTKNMDAMVKRMETLTDEEIQKQTQKLNAQVTTIEGKIAAFEEHNNKQIAQLEEDIRKAKEQGDAATLAKLEELKNRLKEADESMDALNQKVDKWQGQLNSIAAKDYTATYAAYKKRIEALNDIDMEKRYQNMQAMLKALSISQYETLTHDDLEAINGLINRINNLYKNVYQQYETIDGDLNDWEMKAESECSDLETLASELASIDLDAVEEVFNNYDGYDGKVDDINTWADDFQNFIDEIQNAVQEVDEKVQEAGDLAEEINNDISNLEVVDHSETVGAIDSIGQQLADDMNAKLQELSDAYPHAWGGSTPSVSW